MAESSHVAIWAIALLATAGVVIRPRKLPEAVWAVLGSAVLVLAGLLPWRVALHGVAQGTEVYLFLAGMMLLAELARLAGLFDWLAALAALAANGSAKRLFALVFAVGTIVTVVLSNDATAVVLTPAVAAIARAAGAGPLPYLFICAFTANAASFVLPISNPANLVIYGSHMPPLLRWLPAYALPSAASILATFAVLRWTQARHLHQTIFTGIRVPRLSAGARMAALGIGVIALLLLGASALGLPLGLPTFLAGVATAILVIARSNIGPAEVATNISWDVLPLVAGLFVLVAALQTTGATAALAYLLHGLIRQSATTAAWIAGLTLAAGCNLVNNLPAGLVAGRVLEGPDIPEQVRRAVLIGVDLGPNLSVTGSLATILWLRHCGATGRA